jgi:adenylate kinase
MRVVFIGPPGAGKGTQSQRLLRYLNVPHVSTGELLRDVVRRGTNEGLQAESYMNQGMLVPDPIMIKLVGMRLDMPDCKLGCLLDGFPRTLGQAKALDDYLNSHAIPLDCVLELRVNEEVLIQRLAGRGREDDDPAVIRKRLQMYRERTEPLLDYYAQRGLLATINGVGTTDEVFQQIQAAVDQYAVRRAQSATNPPQPGP